MSEFILIFYTCVLGVKNFFARKGFEWKSLTSPISYFDCFCFRIFWMTMLLLPLCPSLHPSLPFVLGVAVVIYSLLSQMPGRGDL